MLQFTGMFLSLSPNWLTTSTPRAVGSAVFAGPVCWSPLYLIKPPGADTSVFNVQPLMAAAPMISGNVLRPMTCLRARSMESFRRGREKLRYDHGRSHERLEPKERPSGF